MRNLLICFILAGLTSAVYWPAHRFGFVNYDDQNYIYENKHVAAGLNWSNIAWAFETGEMANYHPLTWLSYLVDSSLFGVDPAAFHVENILFHIFNSLLLFGILKRATGDIWPSAFVAGIFALHPAHVESVAWISERKDVLSTAFLLLAMWAYLGYVRANSTRRKWTWYAIMFVCFALGLLSKGMIVTFPFVLLLLDYWPLCRDISSMKRWTEKLPLFFLAGVSGIVTFQVQRAGGALLGLQHVPVMIRIENIFISYIRYAEKSVWPIGLSPFYPYRADWSGWVVGSSVFLTILASVLFFAVARRRPYLIVGWLWFLGTLVPVIGIVQAGGQSIADRYLYVPLVGLAIIFAWLGKDLVRFSRPVVIGIGATVLIAAAITARCQVMYWHDTRTLFNHALAVTPRNSVAHVQLGYLDSHEGHAADAVAHYEQAIDLAPTDYVPEFDLANLLLATDPGQAIEHYRLAAEKNPRAAKVQNNWAKALIDLRQPREAYDHFRLAVQLDPDDAEAHANLGRLFFESGYRDFAERQARAALQLDPDLPQAKALLQAIAKSATQP